MSLLAADVSALYRARRGMVDLVDVPPLFVIAVDGGRGADDPTFAEAVRSLYAVSHSAHLLALRLGYETREMPLEALWSAPLTGAVAGAGAGAGVGDREASAWTALVVQPEPIDEPLVVEALEQAVYRTGVLPVQVRHETFTEGPAAQTVHVGPYAEQGPTVALLHARIAAHGLRPRGRHHEIYLADPRHAAPDRLRTILRQPVEKA